VGLPAIPARPHISAMAALTLYRNPAPGLRPRLRSLARALRRRLKAAWCAAWAKGYAAPPDPLDPEPPHAKAAALREGALLLERSGEPVSLASVA